MMRSILSRLLLAALLVTGASCQLLNLLHLLHPSSHIANRDGQSPIMDSSSSSHESSTYSSLLISDVIARNQAIGIFSSLTRDIDTVSSRLESSTLNSTILAPENSEMTKLPRKPWEDPEDYKILGAEAYAGDDGQGRAHENLKRFVEAHVVPLSPWKAGDRVKTLAGSEIWWESRDGMRYVQTGNVEVIEVADTVANGEVWILRGVLNYAR